MSFARYIKRQTANLSGLVLVTGLSLYFAAHLIGGEHGLVAWARRADELRQVRIEADRVRADLVRKQQQITYLEGEHLGPDHLDSAVRKTLNLAAPGEIIIMNEDRGR